MEPNHAVSANRLMEEEYFEGHEPSDPDQRLQENAAESCRQTTSIDGTARFRYKPLGSEKTIRLLKITRISQSDSLHCTMIHMDRYNLLHGPGFIALSYRWGDESIIGTMQLRNVFVHGTTEIAEDYETKELPQSTLDMLVELYKTERITDRWFWIDVLCLNQADILEKSAQVRLMGSIFELASEALVYVGPQIESTALAMEFWEKLRVTFAELPQVDADGKILYLSYEEILRYTDTTWASPEWQALQQHLTRPWFRRLWVMQEAVLPRSVTYVWGRFALTAHDMPLFAYWDMRSNLGMMLYQHDSSCWFSDDPYTTWYFRNALELVKTRHPPPWSASFYASFWRTLTFNTSDVASDVAQFPPAEYGDTLASLDVVKESGILANSSTRVSTSVQKQRFLTTAMAFGSWHAVCVTASGLVGLVPRYTTVGDVVAVCPGARAPFVLRSTGNERDGKKVFQFVGTGYVHELNEGIHVAASKGELESIVLR
ncbi:hypothetical protein LTR48_001115 [Friedmanniomyces endolithicus]|uniref:Heterokaryon incompatibility domain-containing protein n=1 Tax=Rachicladosporium monterosium TaxID=1507873 RepID=A0ABR0LEH0_9PEZI|nr:hypothetical protein LTR48_001115 [Friedmanniomyces endolithicus]KAK5147584.1 hypothetical protein LTR32_001004 [Rachicladosporium monterosium]